MRSCPSCARLLENNSTCLLCTSGNSTTDDAPQLVATTTAPPVVPPAAPARADQDPRIGRTIAGRYEVIELIGEGGMGQVYRAQYLGLNTDVCIKVLRPGKDRESDAERFKREAYAAGRLRSAHCVQVLDTGEEPDGLHYIAMEFIQGRNLKRLLAEEFPLGDPRDPSCMNGPGPSNLCGYGDPVGGPMIVQDLYDHARLLGQQYGDLVDDWCTVNEPQDYLVSAYGLGSFPR